MNRKIIFLICFILQLCACVERKSSTNVIEYLSLPDVSVKLESVDYDEKTVMGIPGQIELINNELFLFESYGCVAQIISIDDGKQIGCFGKKGQGPGEHISPYFSGYNTNEKNLYIWDVSLKSMTTYQHKLGNDTVRFVETDRVKKDKENSAVYFDVHYIGEDRFVAVASYGDSLTNYFSLLNKDQIEIKRFGHVPFLSNLHGMNLRRLNGTMSSYGTDFVFAAMNYGYIVCYDISPANEIIQKWSFYLSEPKYTNKAGEIVWNDDNKHSFFDVKMNSKYIFALYSGKEMFYREQMRIQPKNLLVFDLNGTLVKLFELDELCVRIAVTEDNIIYAISIELDSKIVKYDLSNYL